MMNLYVPKSVVLPNLRTSAAHYKQISRAELPPNILMHRTYRQRVLLGGCKRRHRGRGIFFLLKKLPKTH